MTTVVLQSAKAAAPFLIKTAKTAALAYAKTAISNAINPQISEGPRLETLHIQTSRDGAPMPRVFGRVRLAGQLIWASQFKEAITTSRQGGGKGGPKHKDYSYTVSFAIGLCEGEILSVERLWANGQPLNISGLTMRVHTGTETQDTDPIIGLIDGDSAPGFRGTAYIVFEDFPLDDYGARLPQINAEILRAPAAQNDEARLETLIESIDMIPGSGEFVYSVDAVDDVTTLGQGQTININNLQGLPDVVLAVDQLQARLPHCKTVNIVVSWFGDDLRAGHCQLRPGVESRDRKTVPDSWQVAGYDRQSAMLISRLDDKPVYGGTPSDASLLSLMSVLKSRGLKAALYPFILMDIPEEKAQPAFPWRGRISCHGDDQVENAELEIDNFYSQYRAMILHYAAIAAKAGGADSFIIGSELRGLTSVRGIGRAYPFVAHLQNLAAEVRDIVGPDCGLTYAADWSEYFGHHAGDDVVFHLDPLWAHPAIDAVGIDAYFPLSDWRDGDSHLDAALGGPHDTAYLSSNIEGGEGYDYFYQSRADRDAQIRTPITDGAYEKPWVYRYKDIRSWWGQPHFNRIAGIEQSSPTAWQPQSKPIWFTEIGCPAVDKGSNQPNVFYDPKSSESFLPYHSRGERDDIVQRRYLESFISYWQVESANNPVSAVYGGLMVAPDRIAPWCWDARPFPDFPARRDVWSDGENWARGHWLSGRLGSSQLGDIVRELVLSSGASEPDVSALSGLVSGYTLDRPMSGRAAIEPLAMAFGFTCIDTPNGLKFFHHNQASTLELDDARIVANPEGSAFEFRRRDIEDAPQDVRLHFIDIDTDYQSGMVSAQNRLSESVGVTDILAPLGLSRSQARTLCETILTRAQMESRALNFTLMPGGAPIAPGDVISLAGASELWQITDLDGLAQKRVSALPFLASVAPDIAAPIPQILPPLTQASLPQIEVLDIPHMDASAERGGPLIAAYSDPWSPVRVTVSGRNADISAPSPMGVLLNDLKVGPAARLDYANTIDVRLRGAELLSLPLCDMLAGQNVLAIKSANMWEIIQFQNAQLIAPQTYRLSNLLRGQGGSKIQPAASGSIAVLLTSALTVLQLSPDLRGETLSLSAISNARSDLPTVDFTYSANHLTPLPPVHLKTRKDGDVVHISWIRQTRLGGDDWASRDVPMAEEHEVYRVQIVGNDGETVWSSTVEKTAATAPVSAIEQGAHIRVSQVSARVGEGLLSCIADV